MSLFHAKEFAVNCSFGDRTTVYRKIFLTSARRIIVDYSWEYFFSDTTFSYYQHTKIRRRHLKSNIKRTIQPIAIANDVISLLYFLQFRSIHLVTKLLI